MTAQEAKNWIRPMLADKRYHHSLCVAKEAVRLAKRFGADPEKATGLDGALKTMADLPAGSVVLAIIGAGLVLFGIYSVLRSRYAPM